MPYFCHRSEYDHTTNHNKPIPFFRRSNPHGECPWGDLANRQRYAPYWPSRSGSTFIESLDGLSTSRPRFSYRREPLNIADNWAKIESGCAKIGHCLHWFGQGSGTTKGTSWGWGRDIKKNWKRSISIIFWEDWRGLSSLFDRIFRRRFMRHKITFEILLGTIERHF